MQPNRTCLGLLLLTLTALLASCAQMPTHPPRSATFETSRLPTRVAVLPFVNRTSSPEAGTALRKMFYNFFSSLNYHDLELTLIDTTLKKQGLFDSILSQDPVSMQRIGQLLGVDALITAEILDYGKLYALLYADTSVHLKASMIDCVTGKKLWETEHETHTRQGDVPLSLTGVAGALIKTAVSFQQASILHTAAKLCLEVVQTIPNPETMTSPPPKITYLVHNGGNQLLRPGQRLKAVMAGDPNMSATWDISPLASDLAMQEPEPGIYVGTYTVSAEDRLSFGRIVGHLASPEGARSHWVDVLGPVALGEPTPLKPTLAGNTVLTQAKSPYLADSPVIVPPQATLMINPGTVIWFKTSAGLGVQGELQIKGTEDAPVRLSGLGSSAWKGILLENRAKKSTVSHCRISGAQFGLRGYEADLKLDHCLITDNIWNVVLEQSSCDMSNCLIRSAQRCGVSIRDSEAEIWHSMIVDNTNGGLLLDSSRLALSQCSLFNNGDWDLKSDSQSGPLIQAANNWWGTAHPEELRVQGEMDLKPLLDSPPDFQFVSSWMNEPI